jgi:hypothetical protein
MLYFVPDWVDRVDPDFNFQEDNFSRKGSDRYTTDLCVHQIFDTPPFDGVLVSLSVIEALPLSKRKEVLKGGSVRKHLKLEGNRFKKLIVMGDCGAFSYVNLDRPAYTVDKVIGFYERLHFDWGVAPDHMIVDKIYEVDSVGEFQLDSDGKRQTRVLTESEKANRKQITLDNAEEFYRKAKRKKFPFVPFASAQGWDVDSYQDSVRELLKIGYTHIAIGGMARRVTDTVLTVLTGIEQVIEESKLKDKVSLHLLGVGRPEIVEKLMGNGIATFDSGSFYRNAWTREKDNYYTIEHGWYAAIRIPQSKSQRMLDAAEENGISVKQLRSMEQEALEALRAYDQDKLSLTKTLSKVLSYDLILWRNGVAGKLEAMYKRTLKDKPWKNCCCKICKETGVEVIIFRGGNRNRRRGFHNMKIFYDQLQLELTRVRQATSARKRSQK